MPVAEPMIVSTKQALGILLVLQSLVALLVFSPFITGQSYFAYFDIGSDSYGQVMPNAMHMARQLAREGWTGWSFELGLGGPTPAMLGGVFSPLYWLGGPDSALTLRFWVYLLKIIAGGAGFFLLIRSIVTRWEAAVISALAYSFCGFVAINGQWDLEATEFLFFPLLLWAILKTLRDGSLLVLPTVLAIALCCSVFFVSTGVFIVFACLSYIVIDKEPRHAFSACIKRVFPGVILGYAIAAPWLLPLVMQMLDTSRVSDADAQFQKVILENLSLNSWPLILAQVAGLFHKDIFGIGSAYRGYWNYLEGPEFYIGITLLIVIPQLWGGDRQLKKVLLISLMAVMAYMVFPLLRHMAFGFSVPYFRVSTLWVSMVLLLLAALALDRILLHRVDKHLLLIGILVVVFLLLLVQYSILGEDIVQLYLVKLVSLICVCSCLLFLFAKQLVDMRFLPLALLALVLFETVFIVKPSFTQGRSLITPSIHAQVTGDGSAEAIQAIRRTDSGIYRIEKTFDTLSLADSFYQDYMGVKSYQLHSKGMVDFFTGAGLIPPASAQQSPNYSNWLPNAGDRYMLNSLLGVKYVLSKTSLVWEGLALLGKSGALYIYKNNYALPLGIVQTRQVTQKMLAGMSVPNVEAANMIRDVALINAVVLEQFDTRWGERFALDELLKQKVVPVEDIYFKPAQKLQQTGLAITSFASNKIVGSIRPDGPGMLVFSIPFNAGWALKIDGQPTPLVRANYGMLAATVAAGSQVVELDFELPGQRLGLLLGTLGAVLLVASSLVKKRGDLARSH